MRVTVLVLCAFLLASCGSDKSDFGSQSSPKPDHVIELSTTDRARLLPNALFVAVWNNSTLEIPQLIARQPSLLESANADGNTPLGLALTLGYLETTEALLKGTPSQALFHANLAGESYVFLASRSGFSKAIRLLADLYYDSLGGLQRYSFARLDFPNALGERALFVATDRQVAQTLQTQYYRGALTFPFWRFTLRLDKNGDNFLHTAARDGRSDVILWAAENICQPGSWQQSRHVWISFPSRVLSRVLREAETYTYLGDLDLPTAALFNRQDANGETPLHAAIGHHQWSSVRALAHCSWLDYDLSDNAGDVPLQSFLKQLNPYLSPIDPDAKSAFTFLLSQNTQTRRWSRSVPDRVNWTNQEGETALHLAARLADPYFYQALESVGDTQALNKSGISAESLFQNRQAQVRTHAR